jgi:L-glutamine-phosphate cytidylyltransferase
MKALILSAGQGKRLLPYTAASPKCTIPVLGRSVIEWQIDTLLSIGIDRVTVVVGYGADNVERLLKACYGVNCIKLLYNPEFAETNNLVSCWWAREEMNEDFLLLNGDTLFEESVLRKLLDEPVRPVTVTIDHKDCYDADDMKVTLEGSRLVDIGKDIAPDKTGGESIGMILFRGEGPALFRAAIENALQDASARNKFYLSVIREMAQVMPVHTCSIMGLNWCEIDYPADLKNAEEIFKGSLFKMKKLADSSIG